MTTENDAIAFYIEMLIFGLRLNVEYLVVYPAFIPENIFNQIIKRKHFTKIISAHTVDSWDLAQFLQLKKDAHAKSCDIVQITSHAYSLQHNIDLMKIGTRTCNMIKHKGKNSDVHINKKLKVSEEEFNDEEEENLENAQIPIIAYNTGTLGRMSKSLNRLLTPVEHEAFLDNPKSFYYKSNNMKNENLPSVSNVRVRPNQDNDPWLVGLKGRTLETLFTLKDRNNCIYSSGLQPKLHFYHFGNTVEKRLSHVVHQAAFDAVHLPHRYSKKWSSQLREIQPYFEQPEFGGAALSQPFKVESLQLCDTLSSHARFIGAINTITATRLPSTLATASIHGDNVDWVAIHTCLSKYLRPQNIITPESRVLILGAGGFGHAAVYALARLGVRKFYIYNRTRENAELLVSHFQTLFSRNNIFPVDKISTNEGPRGDFATRNEEISTFLHNKRPRRLLLKSILNDEEESNSSPCQDDNSGKLSLNHETPTTNVLSTPSSNNTEKQHQPQESTATSATSTTTDSSSPIKGKSVGTSSVPFKHPFQKLYAESPEKFWTEIIENSKGKRNYGSLTFQNDSTEANKFSFTILDDVTESPWPDPTHGPRLILQMSSNSDITLHPSFYEAPSNPISANSQGISRSGVSSSTRARICLDTNYIPSQLTPFIRQALSYRQQDQNVEVIGGAELMIEQAFNHFEILTEKRAPKAVMVETLKKALNELDSARSLEINNSSISTFPNLEASKPRAKPVNNINIDDSSSSSSGDSDSDDNGTHKPLSLKSSNNKPHSLSNILINNDQEQLNVATTSTDRPNQTTIASPCSSTSFTSSYSSTSASEIEED